MTRTLLRLHRKSRTPAWRSLMWRVLLAVALFALAIGVHWFDREGLRDNVDGAISFLDVIYFTSITVTTVGFGDIVPVTDRARMFDTFIVTPIRIFIWLIFLGTAYDFLFKNLWERWRMSRIQATLDGHVVIAGFGLAGAAALGELRQRGRDAASIVVVDPDATAIEAARDAGAAVLQGDATRNATLEAVRIDRAASLIVASGRDDTSILIVLTAHGLAPRLPVSVVVRSADNEPLARQAGATTVINPASFAGLLLAGSTVGPHVADYLADLAATDGLVALHERRVTPGEVGKPLAAIATGQGVRLYRGGRCISAWEPDAGKLVEGDVIVEIVPQPHG